MPRLNNDEQFKFLISCIRYSNNGKVDFSEVAKECSIVSKGAAAKRYERMMKAHGIHQPTHAVGRDTAVPPMRSKSTSSSSNAAAKKRKIDEFDNANVRPTSNEIIPKKVKGEDTVQGDDTPVKKEEPVDQYPWFYTGSKSGDHKMEEPAFNDFLASTTFESINSYERQGNQDLDKEMRERVEGRSVARVPDDDVVID